jgi:hypothetical protein
MTKRLKAMCSVFVFVLVLPYAAHAGSSFQLNFTNELPDFCKIGGQPTYSLDTTAAVTDSATTSPKIDFGANFSNPDATGRAIMGSVHFAVYRNTQCSYVLTSAYGALKNLMAGQTGAFRDYYADAHDASGSGTLVHLNGLSPNTFVNQFTNAAPIGIERRSVVIEFSIPQTSTPLAAGQYQDILSLTITPSI